MKTIVFAIFGFLATQIVFAQEDLVVYKTYSDYVDNKGEAYSFEKLFWPTAKTIGLIVSKGKEKIKINPEDTWGYKYKNILFRFDHAYNHPVKVARSGELIFYENGQAGTLNLQRNSSYADSEYGFQYYVSKNLETEIVPIDNYKASAFGGELNKRLSAFKTENPECKSFFECLGEKYDYPKILSCLSKFGVK